MKNLLLLVGIWLAVATIATGQCTEQPVFTPNNQPVDCVTAVTEANITPFFEECRTLCFDNTGAGNSGSVTDLSCLGGSADNDIYLYFEDLYQALANFDGSWVIRWVDWPNKDQGALPPYLAMHNEVSGSTFGGLVNINNDCTSPAPTQNTNFANENSNCIDPSIPDAQAIRPPGSLLTVPETEVIATQEAGMAVDLTDITYWFNIVTSDGAEGPICLEVSTYAAGSVCGDALPITLTGSSTQVSGSASGCLCETAAYGGLQNPVNNLPLPCASESPASVWYEIDLPFECNSVEISVPSWGGSDQYNLALLSAVDCPGVTNTNPQTGIPLFTPGRTLEPGTVIEASACNQTLSSGCNPLPAGTYYVYISGSSERPSFNIDVTVNDASATAGSATSPQNGNNVCSASIMEVSTSGSIIPAGGTCGQDIAWFYSSDINFDPYAAEGTYAGSGTVAAMLQLPSNMNCTPVTYYVRGIVSDDGFSPSAGCPDETNLLNVTVYPEIGDVNVLNTQCFISLSARCPNFTVNGNSGSDTYSAVFAEDGNTVNFTVSNGLPVCNQVFPETVSCSGSCTQPTASASSVCDPGDPFNFYVDVVFQTGSAAQYTITGTDGSAFPVSADGTYRVGPFTNGSSVDILIENSEDSDCNLSLGSFSDNCNPSVCPNLTSAVATLAGDACEGDLVLLQATVDQGIFGQDYVVQWMVNGTPIPGAIFLNFNYNVQTSQGCTPEVQIFSIELTCLVENGAPANTPNLPVSTGPVTVYPIPQIGVDFVPDPSGCIVAPIDNCGTLEIQHSPTTNLNPGDPPTVVNYTVSVTGAPQGCAATGSYVVQCIECPLNPGSAITPPDNTYCFGESFDIESTGAALDAGYVLGYAVTTNNPFGNLETTVVDALNGVGDVIGPFPPTGAQTLVNGTDFGPGTFYFTPFVSLDLDNSAPIHTQSGSFSVAVFASPTINITIPPGSIPHCQGTTAYNIFLTVNRTSGSSNSIDDVNGLVDYNGGATANVSLENLNYTNDPNGGTITIEASNLNIFAGTTNYDWNLTVEYAQSYAFPTLCGQCIEAGNAAVFELLPDITLSSILQPAVLCEGSEIDLTIMNPTANMPGSFTWYDDNPDNGGSVIQNPSSIIAVDGEDYWVVFTATADASCTAIGSVSLNTTSGPSIATPAQPDAICQGDEVDLTMFEAEINVNNIAGTFTWFKGNPETDPFAVQLTTSSAMSQFPVDGISYYAVFEESGACTSQVSITYTVNDLPTLNALPMQIICSGGFYDLSTIESQLTSDMGTFDWYLGDPESGGTLIVDPQNATINNNDILFTIFTDNNTSCSAKISVEFTVNDAPVLAMIPAQNPICEGTVIDLTAFEAGINTNNEQGNFVWYLGDPDAGGTLVPDATNTIPVNGDNFYAVFTNNVNCSASVNVLYMVNDQTDLTTPSLTPVCEGTFVDLTALELAINTNNDQGSFGWFEGDPNAGGVIINDPANFDPAIGETIFVVFTNTLNCESVITLQWPVLQSPELMAPGTQGPVCNGSTIDLTALEAQINQGGQSGTFTWYEGDPDAGGTEVVDPTMVTGATSTIYFTVFTNTDNCTGKIGVNYLVNAPVSGITAEYDCDLDQLVVDFSGASGGSGNYQILVNSPNTDGETLANGANWTVFVGDDEGCEQAAISGTVSCIICSAGNGLELDDNIFCCGDSEIISTEGPVLDGNTLVAWALTDVNTGPVTNATEVANAAANGNIYAADESGSIEFNHICVDGQGAIPPGSYFLTPFVAEDPNIEPLTYDEDNGCVPSGLIFPGLSGEGYGLNPFLVIRPDGSPYNIVDTLSPFPGITVTQPLLDGLFMGNLPGQEFSDFINGDPNGIWQFSFTNIDTGTLFVDVPDFELIVSADSCSLINEDELVTITGFSGEVPGNSTVIFSFEVPSPPADFPNVNASCEDYGEPVLIVLENDPCSVSVDEVSIIHDLMVYPNPASELLHVDLRLEHLAERVSIEIFDLLGKRVVTQNLTQSGLFISEDFEVGNLPAGMYLIRLDIDNEVVTRKVVVGR